MLRRFRHLAGVSAVFLSAFLLMLVGCKKDRLTSNIYEFSISPSATSVAKNNARTFVAQGLATNGSRPVEPTWQVLETTAAAVIVPPIGASVDVTFPFTGVYTLVADYDDKRAVAQIRVENSTGPSTALPLDNLPIYTDAGIPSGAHLWTNLGVNISEQTATFDAPEGSNYMRSTMTNHFWMVDLTPSTADLSSFPGGSLKFYIRINRPLVMGENLKMEMEKPNGSKNAVNLGPSWVGFSSSDTGWQSVSIDLNLFFAGIGAVKSPFIFSTSLSSPLIVDIDNVRWEKP